MTETGHNLSSDDERMDAYDPPCPEASFACADAYEALVHAWDLLRFILARFWSPVELYAIPAISQRRKFELLDWLRPVEIMLRRLILIEAMALAPSLPLFPGSGPAPGKGRARQRRKPGLDPKFDGGDSRTWRTSFRVALTQARPGQTHVRRKYPHDSFNIRVPPRQHERMLWTWPIARRIEGVMRAVCDPMSRIRRLARSIRRKGAPDLGRLAKQQRLRLPCGSATLNTLADILGLARCRVFNSS